MNKNQDNCNLILKKWSDRSINLIESMTLLRGLTLSNYKDKFPVHEHYRTSCFMTSEIFNLEFKVYFTTENAMVFCQKNSHLASEFLSLSYIIDFTKELTNLVVGSIKHDFENLDVKSVLSFPMQIRSFDELFIKKNLSGKSKINLIDYYEVFWRVNYDSSYIVISICLEITNPTEFYKLNFNLIKSDIHLGEFEYL